VAVPDVSDARCAQEHSPETSIFTCDEEGRGDRFDNAVAESLFATLKKELVHSRSWPTKDERVT
jgi:hypothetical protein